MVYEALMELGDMGLFDVILPFILIFTIVYAVLQKTKLLGDKAKNFNIIISLVMGLGVVYPHVAGLYPPGQDVVDLINKALPNMSIVMVAILMFILMLGLMGKKVELGQNSVSGWVAFLSLVFVIYIFGSAADLWELPSFLYMLYDPNTMSLVVVILVFAIIVWFITKEDKNDKQQKADDFGKKISELLK